MADKSKIEWTDATWSPLRVRVRQDAAEIAKQKGYASLIQIGEKMAGRVGHHCEHASPECDHCYAEAQNRRCLPTGGTGLPYDRRSRDLIEGFVDEKALVQPLRWRRPRKIFVENQSDLFGDWFTDEQRDFVFAVAALCRHTLQILTKRPEEALRYTLRLQEMVRSDKFFGSAIADAARRVSRFYGHPIWQNAPLEWLNNASSCKADPSLHRTKGFPLRNVQIGVTAGTRKSWADRVGVLRQIPAAVRYVSVEPLLEDLGQVDLTGIHWVIAGSESGRGARATDVKWVRSLKNQCVVSNVAFFYKQAAIKGRKIPTPELDGKKWTEFPQTIV